MVKISTSVVLVKFVIAKSEPFHFQPMAKGTPRAITYILYHRQPKAKALCRTQMIGNQL